ncbi:hypothetical protein NpNSSI1_00005070 [Neofusicoccum parvum]|nr:hypothetical protein NpNSSI1_00005070 [Neofusicoccum parvum]
MAAALSYLVHSRLGTRQSTRVVGHDIGGVLHFVVHQAAGLPEALFLRRCFDRMSSNAGAITAEALGR